MSKYKISLKRTDEITEKEWVEYIHSFNLVFNKEFTFEYFKHKYFCTALGFSYHGVLTFDDIIVGMFTIIPRRYFYDGKEITIGLGCDAFILKEHRKDEFFLKDMSEVVTSKFSELGVSKFISIPNKSAYNYWLYYGGWKDIGELDYYLIPLKISKLTGKFDYMDKLSFFTFKTIAHLCNMNPFITNVFSSKTFTLVRNEKFYDDRYNSEYIIKKIGGNGKLVYRICLENEVRMAYIIDCFPQTKSNISNSIEHIINEESGNIDAIMYVGTIENPPFYFMKVPKSKVPRIQHFIGLSTHDDFDSDFFNLNSWDVSLANFDNR